MIGEVESSDDLNDRTVVKLSIMVKKIEQKYTQWFVIIPHGSGAHPAESDALSCEAFSIFSGMVSLLEFGADGESGASRPCGSAESFLSFLRSFLRWDFNNGRIESAGSCESSCRFAEDSFKECLRSAVNLRGAVSSVLTDDTSVELDLKDERVVLAFASLRTPHCRLSMEPNSI